MWKSGMLARCVTGTCTDMLSVGVCDRASVHTLTVLVGDEYLRSEDIQMPPLCSGDAEMSVDYWTLLLLTSRA